MVRRKPGWLYLILVVLLIGTLAVVASCAGDDEEPTTTGAPGQETTTSEGAADKTPGGTAVEYIDEPAFIDPVNAQESEGIEVVANIFDSLVSFDPKTSEIMPAVAESWEANEDATVWTFNLRQGVMFHNGREVKAQDFKYAWERMANPENQSEISYHLDSIQGFAEMQDGTATELSGVRAVDDYTLEVTLSYPFSGFEYVVGHPSLAPVPQEAVEEDPAAFAEQPVGNGPFMLDGPWQHDQLISVVRFDDYYGEKALLDGVNFQVFRDEETAFLEFRAGNVDFTHIPPGQIEATKAEFGESDDGFEAAPGKQVLIGPELAIYYMGINMNDPILGQSLELRKAISLAINREAINQTVYEGVRKIAGGFVPEGIPGFEENAWGENSQYNPDMAKQLMEQAGYPNGEGLPTFSLGFNSGAGHEEVMQLVQADLAAIGIKVEFETSEFAQFLDARDEGRFALYRSGWLADYPTQDNFLYPLFQSEAADNDSFYKNPEVDQGLLDARSTVDEDERETAYLNVEKMIGEDIPVVPFNHYRHRDVVSARINGFIFDPIGLGHWDLAWISE